MQEGKWEGSEEDIYEEINKKEEEEKATRQRETKVN